uniref:HBV DNAPTP1-binding protein 1 n=1 Tax=Homo sapiens TaxID=9606 RepID=Q1ZZU4_HUMAN|nr:HBV DNAPTP1-binding protein 1 [Homo sapiens]ABF54969.1 HBeAg-binding protein 2 binding protein B [Homo sapiens]
MLCPLPERHPSPAFPCFSGHPLVLSQSSFLQEALPDCSSWVRDPTSVSPQGSVHVHHSSGRLSRPCLFICPPHSIYWEFLKARAQSPPFPYPQFVAQNKQLLNILE